MITKDKQYLLIEIEDNKQYKINLNDLTIIGLRGSPIKRIPEQVRGELFWNDDNLISAVGYLLNHKYISFENKVKLLSCYEKIYAINKNISFEILDMTTVEKFNKYFKLVSSIIREHQEIGMYEIKKQLERKIFIKTYNIDDRYYDYFDKDTVIEVGTHFAKEIPNLTNKELNNILNIYFFSGAKELFSLNSIYVAIIKYIRLVRFFHTKIEPKNWIKHCSVLISEYELEKDKNDHLLLKQNQDKKELFFENEHYKVIIPTTKNEFKEEANAQSNCVYRLYLSKVIDGSTNIVFIRDKTDLEHSLITCEVKDGRIVQFLKRFNSSNLTYSESLFKEEYQQHLLRSL